jgi:hypothetical protein
MISPVFKYMRLDCNMNIYVCVRTRDLPVLVPEYYLNIRLCVKF